MTPPISVSDRRRADDPAALELAQELSYTKLLQSISTQLIANQPAEALYECLAAAAATLLRSDFATIQILDPEQPDGLSLIAHRGLSAAAVGEWAWVPRDAPTTCGAAFRTGVRVMFPDFEQCECLTGTETLAAFRREGIRSAQSTPLYARDGCLVGMVSTHWRTVHTASERELSLLDILARQAADLIERRRVEDALRDAHDLLERTVDERTKEVRELLARLVNSQEDERRRISREIHDEVGQQMTALRMNIELLTHSPTVEQARHTQRLAEELDRSIDFLAWELRPAALDGLGLSAALNSLVVEWSAKFDVIADYQESGVGTLADGAGLGREIESNIYRVVQEALHNVHKHARAKHVAVRVERRPAELMISVEDDGCGFEPELPSRDTPTRLGIIGMRERAALVSGDFRIESSPEHGTTLMLRIPFR